MEAPRKQEGAWQPKIGPLLSSQGLEEGCCDRELNSTLDGGGACSGCYDVGVRLFDTVIPLTADLQTLPKNNLGVSRGVYCGCFWASGAGRHSKLRVVNQPNARPDQVPFCFLDAQAGYLQQPVVFPRQGECTFEIEDFGSVTIRDSRHHQEN